MSRNPLVSGRTLALASPQGPPLEVQVEEVVQRLWSRVARARIGDRPVFLKQNLDVKGQWAPQQFSFELQGLTVGRQALEGCVRVPELLASDEQHLVMAFEHLELESMDELLRRSQPEFEAALEPCLAQVLQLLERLEQAPGDVQVDVKQRSAGPSSSLCFKGLEIRNLGFQRGERQFGPGSLVAFDLGKPYRVPPGEVAAQVFLSVGLLNWGRPLRRFLRGPEARWLELAKQHLGDRLDREALATLQAKERRQRLGDIRATGALRTAAKRALMGTLGRRYFDRLESWHAQHLA